MRRDDIRRLGMGQVSKPKPDITLADGALHWTLAFTYKTLGDVLKVKTLPKPLRRQILARIQDIRITANLHGVNLY